MHSALRLTNRPADVEQLEALCRAYGDLTGTYVNPDDAEAASAVGGDSLLGAFLSVSSARADTDTQELHNAVRDNLLDKVAYRDFVQKVFAWRDNYPSTENADPDEETEERNTWRSLTREIRRQLGGDPRLGQFLQQVDLRQKTTPPGASDVQCLTIHLAKGKEFQHVYLIGLVEEELPSYRAIRGTPSAIEEERRTCFVAITRVQSSLTLTHASSYFGWPKQPSRFLGEMAPHSGDITC